MLSTRTLLLAAGKIADAAESRNLIVDDLPMDSLAGSDDRRGPLFLFLLEVDAKIVDGAKVELGANVSVGEKVSVGANVRDGAGVVCLCGHSFIIWVRLIWRPVGPPDAAATSTRPCLVGPHA